VGDPEASYRPNGFCRTTENHTAFSRVPGTATIPILHQLLFADSSGCITKMMLLWPSLGAR